MTAYVDAAGNAVGELGEAGAAHVVVLLGHIDTVPALSPCASKGDDGPVLYGRGSVDAKATGDLHGGAARLDAAWLRRCNRVVVVGGGGRGGYQQGRSPHRDRFDGAAEPIPQLA